MEGQLQDQDNVTRKLDIVGSTYSLRSSSEESDTFRDPKINLKEYDNRSSGNEDVRRKRPLKRVKRFSDSESNSDRENTLDSDLSVLEKNSQLHKSSLHSDDSESDNIVLKSVPFKSRIQNNKNSLMSEDSDSDNVIKNKEQQLRMKNKRNKLRDKFKSLITSREKAPSPTNIGNEMKSDSGSLSETDEDNNMASIEKIKQKIKERISFKPSICDPDTSDEESSHQKPIQKQKKERKITKPTSPKPQRMSAKQAMENMQKIKSESNRMLREKEVSLPYHRPKALSLKDIMSKRKLAVSSDGKALPIKMNEQQLKQYAQMLEVRQKEMMELCKSESEEEEPNENTTEVQKDTAANKVNDNHSDGLLINANYINTIIHLENNTSDNIMRQDSFSKNAEENCLTDKDSDQVPKEQDSEISMQLVYNDSASSLIDDQLTKHVEEATSSTIDTEDNDKAIISKNIVDKTMPNKIIHESEITINHDDCLKIDTEVDSQLISLHFNTEKSDNFIVKEVTENITKAIPKNIENFDKNLEANISNQSKEKGGEDGSEVDNEFSDDDLNIADIDHIIENAEIIKDIEDKVNSQFLIRDKPLNLNPKITGVPGMVIDLDDSDAVPKKSGIELLKERFTYFSKLKTPEEMEREKEKKFKPGTQLKKLKEELEEKIAEQRSLEWAKRLEDEKQQKYELKELRGEESEEDDIDKLEAAIEDKEELGEEAEKSESEEEPIEDDMEIKDKPRVKNAMVDDEAEESDCDDNEDKIENDHDIEQNDENYDDGVDGDNDEEENESESDGSDETSESEDEQPSTLKKGRILKAFEDSDEEDAVKSNEPSVVEIDTVKGTCESKSGSSCLIVNSVEGQIVSQDEELQLAQRPKSTSDDLFTSQESALLESEAREPSKDIVENDEAFTQTFSILDSSKQATTEIDLNSPDKLSAVGSTQSLDINNMDDAAIMCPITNSQKNLSLPFEIPTTQLSQSQPIGEDILALCTGQFYNNQFVSQVEGNQIQAQNYDAFDNYPSQDSQEVNEYTSLDAVVPSSIVNEKEKDSVTNIIEPKEADDFIELNNKEDDKENRKHKIVDDNLKSILDELADPEFDSPKPNKFFVGGKSTKKDVQNESHVKKKFIIDSDDEINEANETKNRKKFKKKKPEKRALQISDDEEDLSEQEEIEEYESDIEEDNPERLVEYDSEENEIEVKPQNPKKKRKMTEFFENEAELTSEDEWVGSGDEDEAGLDRMEREEGDDEVFHQGKLQRELGQIHMRDVLDQDKREVRLIQELLFEDGDLGVGSRQRKFRWNNMDGDEETGTIPDNLADTQEEEFESEEQWRKQRHEREMFLRQMQNKDDPDESLNVSVNRTTIIKANLLSKTMSSLLMDVNNSTTEKTESPAVEKKIAKDLPSPMKPFTLLQHSYQGSLLTRGRGALARLAALATPLAADDGAKVGTLGPSSRRNFVFAALTPEEKVPKVTKRKAESNPSTPKLVKKMRTEEKQNASKSSLLDHFKL